MKQFIKFKLIQLNNRYVKDYYDFKTDTINKICPSFFTVRPVFSFLYFLKFLVLIYQNSIFKILYLH